MMDYNTLILDFEDCIIETKSGKHYPDSIFDMKIKPDVVDAIKKFNPQQIFIFSNMMENINDNPVDEIYRSKIEYVVNGLTEEIKRFNFNFCGCNHSYYLGVYGDDERSKCNIDFIVQRNADMIKDMIWYNGIESILSGKYLMVGKCYEDMDADFPKKHLSEVDRKTADILGVDYMDVNEFVSLYGGHEIK